MLPSWKRQVVLESSAQEKLTLIINNASRRISTNVQCVVQTIGYIPLPTAADDVGKVHLHQGEIGTAYDGTQPYLTIRAIL